MIDAHTHLENGDLSIEYVHKFIDAAKEKGITHLQILDHTHRFFEFKDCYKKKLLTSLYVLALKYVTRLKQKVYYPPFLKTTILTF